MSQTTRTMHRRLILELGQAHADDATMRVAAEFALGLGLDLHGLFIEDESLLHLAALPFAREIRLPSHQWQKMDTVRLEAELRLAAETEHRRLRQAAEALGIAAAFEVLRGEPRLCIAGVCTPADIVVMPAMEGANPFAAALLLAAEESGASVLLAPNHAARRTGPVAVVVGGADDTDLPLAARMAETNHERLLVVAPETGTASATLKDFASGLGIAPDRLTIRGAAGSRLDDVMRALIGARERIVILTRQTMLHLGMDDASRIARARGIPVLVL